MAINLEALSNVTGLLTARHAGGSLVLGGIDLLAAASTSQSVTGFTYTDNTNDQADDLSIEIADPQRTWMQTFLPKKGIECSAKIKVFNWTAPGDTKEFDCGTFWIDQIDCQGPPNTVSVRATSLPITTGIKNEKKYRMWEGQDLKQIAEQIAGEHGLTLVWDSAKTAEKMEHVEETEMPNLEFLRDLAKDNSMSLKVFNKQLIFYSEEEYEAKPAVYVLTYGSNQILSYDFSSKLDDTYKDAKNAYVATEDGKNYETTFVPPKEPEGGGTGTMTKNERVEPAAGLGALGSGAPAPELRVEDAPPDFVANDSAAGVDKLKSQLREKNKHEKTATIQVVGNPGYLSGLNVEIVGFGAAFDGKWKIDSSIHSISSGGYVTELQIHMALEGY